MTSPRPVVGIAGYQQRAQWDMWDTTASVLAQYYVDAVTSAGARTVVLPPDTLDDAVLDRLDGLLLPGGPDLGPALHGQPPHPSSEDPQPLRDAAEMLLLRGALRRDLPVLGVCRGLQLLGLEYGATLVQHLPDVVGHDGHSPADGSVADHDVDLTPGSVLARLHGSRTSVNSHHHQAVADDGRLTVTARTADGVVEGAEDLERDFVVGVQWHPELSGDTALFEAFVAACARRLVGPSPRHRTRNGDATGRPALEVGRG